MTKTNLSAKSEDISTSAGNHAGKPEDDDACCGDACTSKTCKRVLKALDFGLSDHAPHGHSSHGH